MDQTQTEILLSHAGIITTETYEYVTLDDVIAHTQSHR
jgi:hypothetical protein